MKKLLILAAVAAGLVAASSNSEAVVVLKPKTGSSMICSNITYWGSEGWMRTQFKGANLIDLTHDQTVVFDSGDINYHPVSIQVSNEVGNEITMGTASVAGVYYPARTNKSYWDVSITASTTPLCPTGYYATVVGIVSAAGTSTNYIVIDQGFFNNFGTVASIIRGASTKLYLSAGEGIQPIFGVAAGGGTMQQTNVVSDIFFRCQYLGEVY